MTTRRPLGRERSAGMDRLDAETDLRLRDVVAQLAERGYPRVWIGEPGMTPEGLLGLQDANQGLRRESWEEKTQEERKAMLEEAPEELRKYLSDKMLERPSEVWEDLPERVREQLRHPLEVDH